MNFNMAHFEMVNVAVAIKIWADFLVDLKRAEFIRHKGAVLPRFCLTSIVDIVRDCQI